MGNRSPVTAWYRVEELRASATEGSVKQKEPQRREGVFDEKLRV